MAKEIVNTLNAAVDNTVALLESFSQEEMNKVPFEGSWTAAQVARHIYKSLEGTDKLFDAPAEPANRPAGQKAGEFKKLMEDMDNKMQSPEFIIPEDKEYNKQELIQSLKDVKQTALNASNRTDLESVPPLQEGHPLRGATKLELVHFMAYHTQRHNHQIAKIRGIVQ
ncbi:MAG: DinB family protein [Flavobacterium sp.]